MQNRIDCALRPAPEKATAEAAPAAPWERPRYEVISLDCEITAYAPDGDGPLF
jgi:hypothetical protein